MSTTWIGTKRIVKSGAVNFKRSGVVSLASILVMTVTLSVIASMVFLKEVLNVSIAEINSKVDITIYFNVGAPEDKILSLKSYLEKLPEVASATYSSDDQVLENFKKRHENDYLTIQGLKEVGANPLGAQINVKAKDVSQYEGIAKFLEGDSDIMKNEGPIIDKINYHQNKIVIDRLIAITAGAQRLGFILAFFLIVVSILITFNTIRLAIFISKEEIGIMRLVGAENKYIRGPFMVSGAIYGLVAGLITLALLFPATVWFAKNMTDFLAVNLFNYYLSNFFSLAGIILGSGVILGVISSYIAVMKYLKK